MTVYVRKVFSSGKKFSDRACLYWNDEGDKILVIGDFSDYDNPPKVFIWEAEKTPIRKLLKKPILFT